MVTKRLIECRDCGKTRPHYGYGLCSTCRCAAARSGVTPMRIRDWTPGTIMVEEYEWLRDSGIRDLGLAAVRLGVKRETLYAALYRLGYRPDPKRGGYYQ